VCSNGVNLTNQTQNIREKNLHFKENVIKKKWTKTSESEKLLIGEMLTAYCTAQQPMMIFPVSEFAKEIKRTDSKLTIFSNRFNDIPSNDHTRRSQATNGPENR
jgi:hypothetical protein